MSLDGTGVVRCWEADPSWSGHVLVLLVGVIGRPLPDCGTYSLREAAGGQSGPVPAS